MFEKLREIEAKYEETAALVNDPAVIAEPARWGGLMKELSKLQPVVEKFREYGAALGAIEDDEGILADEDDEEMRRMAKEDLNENRRLAETLSAELTEMLLPKDADDEKNVIVEIRGGAGGDEAALFAGDLFRMYSRYAERRRWKTEVMSVNENDLGGFKEVVFMLTGAGAYSRLKYESGVHRVQRVPVTESSGRIHTSTVTVAVLPETDDVDVRLNMNDVRVDVFRTGGNGGQSVNTTDSAVRLTHLPTGIVISMQDERSQLKNKDKAFKLLRAKLYDLELEKKQSEYAQERRSQVGTGNRNERIRTYNFPQGRVTDHRIGFTSHNLPAALDGELDELMDALAADARAESLKGSGEE